MIPQTGDTLQLAVVTEEPSSRTRGIVRGQDGKTRLSGELDGLEAVRQAVFLILNVQRYEYLIHSWNYGVELRHLLGRPIPFVLPEIKRCVREALLQDSRITGVDGFSFDRQGKTVLARFTVHTVFGDVEAEKEVEI